MSTAAKGLVDEIMQVNQREEEKQGMYRQGVPDAVMIAASTSNEPEQKMAVDLNDDDDIVIVNERFNELVRDVGQQNEEAEYDVDMNECPAADAVVADAELNQG